MHALRTNVQEWQESCMKYTFSPDSKALGMNGASVLKYGKVINKTTEEMKSISARNSLSSLIKYDLRHH